MRLVIGLRPDPLQEAYSAPPDLLAELTRSGKREWEGWGRRGKRKGKEGKGRTPNV